MYTLNEIAQLQIDHQNKNAILFNRHETDQVINKTNISVDSSRAPSLDSEEAPLESSLYQSSRHPEVLEQTMTDDIDQVSNSYDRSESHLPDTELSMYRSLTSS